MAAPEYVVEYDRKAIEELKKLRRFAIVKVISAIERYLRERPTWVRGTRIKRLDPPVLATYRLRINELRVFYDVEEESRTVRIIAIRAKGRRTLGEATDDPRD